MMIATPRRSAVAVRRARALGALLAALIAGAPAASAAKELRDAPGDADMDTQATLRNLSERLLKVEGAVKPEDSTVKRPWFEKISIRGYTQIRYNRLLENNKNLTCEQCDKSLGDGKGFFIRRARLVFSGDVSERVYMYMQPDFATDASATSLHFTNLRDLYFDLALDPAKEYRLRVGQSKVPYGWENLQSSQNRLALDRNDAFNSAVSNERDLGVFFMWAPEHIRQRFSALVNSGLKGSGDYGVFAAGVHNGQTPNKVESNNSPHSVARLSYPFRTPGGQFIEAGVQGYVGRYVIVSRTAGVGGSSEVKDRRAGASFIVYPQPFGFQAEYTFGDGPEYDAPTNSIQRKALRGGYVQTMYMWRGKNDRILTPFVRAQYYQGGKKHETDARSYLVRELEFGAEYQFNKNLELVAMYAHSDRAYEDRGTRGNRQEGGRLRLQLQINY